MKCEICGKTLREAVFDEEGKFQYQIIDYTQQWVPKENMAPNTDLPPLFTYCTIHDQQGNKKFEVKGKKATIRDHILERCRKRAKEWPATSPFSE
jgi:hypothetical protein